jgi:rhomboid protease GluP
VRAPVSPAAGGDDGPREGVALLRGGLSDADANRILMLLASIGIEATAEPDAYRTVGVYVPEAALDVARRVLADESALAVAERGADAARLDLIAPKAWFGRGSIAVFAVMAVCVAVFVAALRGADAGTRSAWLALGAIDAARVDAGEHWRLLTAVFLHFDIGHLLANLGVLAIVGPPLAHQIGARGFLFVFLLSGVGGNVASHLVMPAVALKGGASGAITGVLGALGGVSLRPERRGRRKAWQTLGAIAVIYGFLVGFSTTSDNVAHVGGLVVGLMLGIVIRPRPSPRPLGQLEGAADRFG